MSEPQPPELPEGRDAWLHQALRHAPDAAAAPPKALRDAILAEARSAVHPRPRRAAGPSFLVHAAAFWSWLARPPVAAGFASVMAATLVGLMWWDQPMEESFRPASVSSSRVVESTPTLPASQPGPGAGNAPVSAPQVTEMQSAAAPAPADAATARRPMAAPAKTAPVAVDAERFRKDPASTLPRASPAASPFPGNAPGEASALAGSLRDERRQAAPSIDKKAERDAPNEAAGGGNVATPAKPASPTRERATTARRDAASAADTADALGAGGAGAPQAFAAAPRAATSPRARPMTALLTSISQGSARWSLQAASGTRPLDTSAQAWLADVDAATASRWQPTAAGDTRAELPAQAPAFTVLLALDSHAAAIVRVDDAGVFFRESSETAWFAPLPAEAIARLRAALPR